MMRSFVVALVTIVVVSMLGWYQQLAAMSQQTAAGASFSYPVDIAGGTPGVNIEIFLNNGKVGDAAIGTGGDANWVLDLSNVGKTRVTVYVDVCKDGKIVKVAFVTGGGQAPPESEDCDRRIGGVGWWSDCGVTRITINIRTWGARVIGCTPFYQRPPFIGAAGGLVVLPFLFGGDDGPAAITTVPQQPTANIPTVPAPPPTNTTVPAPAPPVEFTVTLQGGSWFHPPGENTSLVCTVVVTNPAQPGAPWTATVQGPFVVAGQNFSGTLNARGQAEIRARISNVGSYTFTVTVVSSGVMRSGTSNSINVTFLNNQCPTAQSFAP